MIGIVSILALFQGVGASNFSPNEENVEVEVSIGAADASKSLFRLARKTRLSLVYRKSDVKGISTNSVEGTYTPEEALMALLEGTLLGVKKDAETGAFAIYRIEESSPKLSQDQTSANLDDPTNENPNQHLDTVMNTKKTRLSKLFAGLLSAFAVTASSNAVAQDENQIDEDIYELSPFIVDTTDDVGYLASNTLAGSRLNASLSDIANAVSVFTPEFIGDIAAIDEQDLMAYSSAAVVEATEQTGAVLGGSFVGTGFQFRIRGMAATRTRDYFETFTPSDTYNIGRVDETRGPNSILFGIGGAGGILNRSTKKAQTGSTFGSVGLTVDFGEYDSIRSTIDFNNAVNDKFAFRVNGVWEDDQKWRYYEFKENKRIHLAATYRISENMTLRAGFESVDLKNTHSRNFVARDRLSTWTNNGETLITNPNSGAQRANGIVRFNNGRERIIYVGNDDMWRNTRGMYETIADLDLNTLLDFTLAPLDAYYPGPGNYADSKFDIVNVALEIKPIDNLFVEFAFNDETQNSYIYNLGQEPYAVRGDPSPNWFGGDVNEYQGDLFVRANWDRSIQLWDVTNYRITAAYEWDTENRWLGRHMVAGLWTRSERSRYRVGAKFTVDDPIAGDPEAGRNRVFARNYIQNRGNAVEYYVPSWEDMETIELDRDGDGTLETIGTRWAPNNLSEDTRENIGYQLSSQSFLFDERVILTMGYRKEDVDESVRGARDPVTEENPNPPILRDPNTRLRIFSDEYNELSRSVENFSYGVVGKVTDWLRVLYNNSENFDIPGNSLGLIPNNELRPILEGLSEDYGVMINLWDNRVSMRAAYFKNTSANDARGFSVVPNVIDRNDRILDAGVAEGLLTSQQADSMRVTGSTWDLADKESDGWEFQLTANPTKNWRLTMNFSSTTTIESNMLKRTRSIMDELVSNWESLGLDLVVPSGNNYTVAEEIENFNDWFRDTTVVEGRESYGHRDFQFRLFTRYDFSDGLLNGFFVGGGYRYSAAPFVGVLANGEDVFGFVDREVDLLFGYKTRVKLWGSGSKKQQLSIQLNIRDLLQENDYTIIRVQEEGNMQRARVVPPTKVTLSGKISF
ncbi:MAG: TonB-dependent receptor [Opitutales bacterium]|nr:TonB-dependent receptor [Opitutales bacterium]